jgi:hypothetical protein
MVHIKEGDGVMRSLRLPSRGTLVFLILIFAAGALHWVFFLNYGNMSFKVHDWAKEFVYYSVLKQAMESGRLPFHIPLAFQETKRFLALPEINMSPQIFLLPLMDVGTFVLVNTLIMYTVGFAGCLMIWNRYRLSPVAFSVLFMLFNFNGHLTAHIGVGHSMWTAYFLLPFFFLYTLEITEGKDRTGSAIKLGFVLFVMILQGGFHIFAWAMAFLALLLIFNWRLIRPVLYAAVSGLLLSAFRLIPAAFALEGKKEKFIWSYPTVRDLLDALVTIRQQTPERLRPWGTPGWWEYDIYIGILGLALVVYFGLYLRFRKKPELEDYRFRALDLPLLTLAVFSISYFHAFLTRIPVPLLGSQRVASRFIIIPVVMLAFIAAIRLQRTLETARRSVKFYVAVIIGLAVMALSFVDHSFIWSVFRLQRIYRDKVVDLSVPGIIAVSDTSYTNVLLLGGIISLASFAGLLYLAVRRRKPARVESQAR